LKPVVLPNFRLGVTYFHIDFSDRISTPPTTTGTIGLLDDPVLASFITQSPRLSVVQGYFNSPGFQGDYLRVGPQGIAVIFDDRYTNLASSTESGVDLNAVYGLETDHFGHFTISLAANRLLENSFAPVASGSSFDLLNTFGEPLKWKGRGSIGWTQNQLSVLFNVNFANSYENNLDTPRQKIASWTTGDVFLSYKMGESTSAYLLRNLTLSLSVQNITNKTPPYVQIPPSDLEPGQNPIPYDPTNASPIGRFIALQVRKSW
jgi:outer membrane receptor protein involved in Fe transport